MKSNGKHYDTDELDLQQSGNAAKRRIQKRRERRERRRQRKVPRWVYRVIAILLAAVAGLLVWFNRENLSPDKIADWIQESVVGLGVGDGFPYSLGDNLVVEAGNFCSREKDAVLVSNTALYVFNSTAKELVNRQHSFSNPVLRSEGAQILIYNQGGTGYRLENRSKTLRKGNADNNIFCGAVAPNGRWALVTKTDGYAARLTAYDVNGDVLYEYWFSDHYPTSVALNGDGTKAAVTTVSARDGLLVSQLYTIDFSVKYEEGAQPNGEYMDNLFVDVFYGSDGTISAVGDRMTVLFHVGSSKTQEYHYGGMQLLAYDALAGRTALSLAPYENSEGSRFVVLNAQGQESIRRELPAQAKSLSLFGDTAAALAGGQATAYSVSAAAEISARDVGQDAAGIALCDESSAYILGISELRMVSFG